MPPLRVLIAKPGLDGHDVGAKLICRALMDAGMEVIYTGLRQTPEAIVAAVRQEHPRVLGLSILSGAHLPLCRAIAGGLRESGHEDLLWIVGGNIPECDHEALKTLGIAAIFPTGSDFGAIVDLIRGTVRGSRVVVHGFGKTLPHEPRDPASSLPSPAPSLQPQASSPKPQAPNLKPPAVCWESGLAIKTVYTAEDLQASGGTAGLGAPGEFPYTRGIHPLMYRARPWTMRQYSGFGTAAETHERFLYLIGAGNTGLNVAFDLPTQCGLDSDDHRCEGEVGRVGMAVDTLADMEEAFAGIALNEITVSLTINGSAAVIMAMYFAMAKKRGFDLASLRGTAQNDILKEFIGRGAWIFGVEPSIRLVTDTLEFCARFAPHYSPVSVCGYHIRESGATPAQEVAYGLSIAGVYVERALERGLAVDDFAPGISFNFDIHGNLWEQVVKLRAGRRLWATLMKEKYGAKNPRSLQLRMIAGGGGGGLTIEQPENNVVRGAYYGLASALAGTQTMALCSYDEAYTIPSEHAAKLSLRTMQIMQEEIGLCDTVDPLGGSYFIESTTNAMEARIRKIMDELHAQGGMVRAVTEGRIQAQVNRQAFEHAKALRAGEIRKVGVNCHRNDGESAHKVALHPYREEEARAQIARLGKVKAERDPGAVQHALAKVKTDAAQGRNVMPAIIEAVERYATVGEVCGALKDVFGSYDEPIRF